LAAAAACSANDGDNHGGHYSGYGKAASASAGSANARAGDNDDELDSELVAMTMHALESGRGTCRLPHSYIACGQRERGRRPDGAASLAALMPKHG
jgi:hypothetical protein